MSTLLKWTMSGASEHVGPDLGYTSPMPKRTPLHTVSMRPRSAERQRSRHLLTVPAHSGHMNYSGVPHLRGVTCRPSECCWNAVPVGTRARRRNAQLIAHHPAEGSASTCDARRRAAVYLPITTRQLADGTVE